NRPARSGRRSPAPPVDALLPARNESLRSSGRRLAFRPAAAVVQCREEVRSHDTDHRTGAGSRGPVGSESTGRGPTPSEYVRSVLERLVMPERTPNAATLALLDAWDAEDATDDPDELARREAEWEELQANLNTNRTATGERPLFP